MTLPDDAAHKGEHMMTGQFHAGVYGDQKRKEDLQESGVELCDYCDGTGNEFYGMYRACPKCAGTGRGDYPELPEGFRWIPDDWHAGLDGVVRCPRIIEIANATYECVGAEGHKIEDHLLRYDAATHDVKIVCEPCADHWHELCNRGDCACAKAEHPRATGPFEWPAYFNPTYETGDFIIQSYPEIGGV